MIMKLGDVVQLRAEPLGLNSRMLGLRGARLTVGLTNDPGWAPPASRVDTPVTDNLIAFVDTGSDMTRIDNGVAARLGLPQVGEVVSNFTGHLEATPVYRAQLLIPGREFVLGGGFGGATLRHETMDADVLLGLDFLSLFDFRFVPRLGIAALTFALPD